MHYIIVMTILGGRGNAVSLPTSPWDPSAAVRFTYIVLENLHHFSDDSSVSVHKDNIQGANLCIYDSDSRGLH